MTTSRCERIVRVVAGLVTDAEGLVRKAGTGTFMQPGGKVQAGETAEQALEREMHEEVGCRIVGPIRHLGQFTAPAANEAGWTVEAEMFAIDIEGEVRPAAEIAEAVWHDPKDGGARPVAPLTTEHVLPMLARMRA